MQAFRHLDFEFALRRATRAERCLRSNRLRHGRRSVPEKQSSPPELEVEVEVAIDVPKIRAAAPRKIERHNRLHFADTAVHAGGDAVLGLLKELRGFGKGVGHGKNSAFSGSSRGSCPIAKAYQRSSFAISNSVFSTFGNTLNSATSKPWLLKRVYPMCPTRGAPPTE